MASFLAGVYRPNALARTTVQRVVEEMRREGWIPEDHGESLDTFDRSVLAVVDELAGKGDVGSIVKTISGPAGAPVLPTAASASLASLESRGLVWARVVRRKADPGHKARRYFNITLAGKRALRKGD